MGYNLPHHIEYNLQTNHFEVSDNVRDVTFVSGTMAVVATNSGIEAFPYNQSLNIGYITVSGGFDRIDHAYDYIYAYSSTSGTIYRTTVTDLQLANGSSDSLVEVYPLREDSNWSNTISDYIVFNTLGSNTITVAGGECIVTDSAPVTDKAFVSYGRELKPPFSIKNRIKISNISYSQSMIDSLLSVSHSNTGINTSTEGNLRASFYVFVSNSTTAKIGLYYYDGTYDWYWDAVTHNRWEEGNSWAQEFNYNVYNNYYTVELVVTADWKVTFNIYNSSETLLETITTSSGHDQSDYGETIPSSSTLWGWFGDNRSSPWNGYTNSAYCTYKSDYFNIYPYWAAYEPVINDFDTVEIRPSSYLGVAVGDDRSGQTGRAVIIEDEYLIDEDFADCQAVYENSYDPRFIRFADGDVYYQLGTGSNSRLYGIMDFWTDTNISINYDVQFNPETGLIFSSTILS